MLAAAMRGMAVTFFSQFMVSCMHSIQIVLAMLLVVAASGYLVRIIPFSMPLPLLQIALGAVISGVFDGGYELQPEAFFSYCFCRRYCFWMVGAFLSKVYSAIKM